MEANQTGVLKQSGHEKGDLLLKQLAELLKGAVRESDLAARYGGGALERMNIADNAPGWVETLMGIIPRNPVQAAATLAKQGPAPPSFAAPW